MEHLYKKEIEFLVQYFILSGKSITQLIYCW